MADSQVASAPASLNFDMDAFCASHRRILFDRIETRSDSAGGYLAHRPQLGEDDARRADPWLRRAGRERGKTFD